MQTPRQISSRSPRRGASLGDLSPAALAARTDALYRGRSALEADLIASQIDNESKSRRHRPAA